MPKILTVSQPMSGRELRIELVVPNRKYSRELSTDKWKKIARLKEALVSLARLCENYSSPAPITKGAQVLYDVEREAEGALNRIGVNS